MKHSHSCQCDHEKVEFCKVCKVVHCLSCNQEWSPRNAWGYQGIWNGGNSNWLGTSAGSGTSVSSGAIPLSTTSCQHTK